MRVESGNAKGRRLQSVSGRLVRPTSGRVRQALFNMLRERVPGSIFVDMFAGTGSVGLEALSQGASYVYFVEKDRGALAALRANVRHCGAEAQATVLAAELPQALQKLPATPQADIIFLDPPYASHLAPATLDAVGERGILAPDGLIIWQHAAQNQPHASPRHNLVIAKRYGNTQLSFLTPAKGAPWASECS